MGGTVSAMPRKTRPPATTAQITIYAHQDVLTTPTAKLAISAKATNVILWRLAPTMRSATREFPTSVTSKTPHTPPASTVRAGNASQDVSQMPTAPMGTRARMIIFASTLPERFSSSRSLSEQRLDYDGSNGSFARFDGTLGGAENDAERTMMGGCYQAPLNAQLNGGTMVWQGTGSWAPKDI